MYTGRYFEKSIIEIAFNYFFKNNMGELFSDMTGTEADVKEGTDMMDGEIPIDWTSAFCTKDHMFVFSKTVHLTHWGDVQYGIRTGNACHTFASPVLVIGFSMLPEAMNGCMNSVMADFENHMSEILVTGEDLYYDYIDSHA